MAVAWTVLTINKQRHNENDFKETTERERIIVCRCYRLVPSFPFLQEQEMKFESELCSFLITECLTGSPTMTTVVPIHSEVTIIRDIELLVPIDCRRVTITAGGTQAGRPSHTLADQIFKRRPHGLGSIISVRG